MKILYGVQGTGTGHISRACAMARAFEAWPNIELTWLLSGRERSKGCGTITPFEWREGISFVARDGKIRPLATLGQCSPIRFCRDVRNLDVHAFDTVVTDFEPVVAHAARRRGIPVIGIGHQYAFQYPVPRQGSSILARAILGRYAPVTVPIGLHWHHFDAPVLPPIIHLQLPAMLPEVQVRKIVVYLPFENKDQVLARLLPVSDHEFWIYHPDVQDHDEAHLHMRAISHTRFTQDLYEAEAVITNCGFELISECLHLGKRVLAKPLRGQMEQLSNAAALEQLGYATVVDSFDTQAIEAWLAESSKPLQIVYPDVAAALTTWIAGGCQQSAAELSQNLWKQTE